MNFPNADYFAAPAPERPKLIIRLRSGHEEPEVWEPLFEQIKKCREICDEVWFSTGIAFPKMDEHRRKSELFAAYAEQLRSIGITPSLQLQATLGHGDRTFADNSLEGKTWGSYIGRNGEVTRSCNCPNQPGFIEYMAEVSRIYAQWQPGSIWLDDDLRLSGHYPANAPYGCHCDDCVAAFSKLENKNYSRSELVKACDSDPELDLRWRAFATRSVTHLTEVIIDSVRKVSPASRFGLQHGGSNDRISILNTIARCTGGQAASRPGGGVDSDLEPLWIIDKAFLCSRQTYGQPGYETLDQVCPEIESYPRNFSCKTAQGLRLETMLYLTLGGGDSMSYFIMDPVHETPESYGETLLAPLAADAPCFREFIRRNENSIPAGVGRTEWSCYDFRTHNLGLPLIGTPQAGYAPNACCLQLTEFAINEMDDETLESILKKNIILDGKAAFAVIARNFGKYLDGIAVEVQEERFYDYCSDDPLNSGIEGAKNFPFSDERFVIRLPEHSSARILTSYLDSKKQSYGAATVIFERPDHTRCAIIGYDGFHTQFISSSRIIMLNRIADWVSHGSLPAMPLEANRCLIVPRVGKDGTLHTVTVLNTTIGTHAPVKLQLRGVQSGANISWHTPQKAPVALDYEVSGDGVFVIIPEIAAWNIGYLAFD